MDSSLSWLVIGSLFSVGTSAVWFLWSRVSRSLHSCIFQFVSRIFALSRHRFKDVSNIVAVTRILGQLGLNTNCYLWQHDANVEAGDKIMVGFIRLPTRTWFLWLMAVMGISHYIWIDDDAREIHITGPTEFVLVLLRLSNVSANRTTSVEEVESLRLTLRLSSTSNSGERTCLFLEYLFGCSFLCGLMFFAYYLHFQVALAVVTGLSCAGLVIIMTRKEFRDAMWDFVYVPSLSLLQMCFSCCMTCRQSDTDVELGESFLTQHWRGA